MDVYFDSEGSQDERAEVDEWCASNQDAGIEYVSVDEFAVAVHGSRGRFEAVSGTALRQGHLADELDSALLVMHRARDR